MLFFAQQFFFSKNWFENYFIPSQPRKGQFREMTARNGSFKMSISFQQFGWKMQTGHKTACLLDMMHNIKWCMQIKQGKIYGNFLTPVFRKNWSVQTKIQTPKIFLIPSYRKIHMFIVYIYIYSKCFLLNCYLLTSYNSIEHAHFTLWHLENFLITVAGSTGGSSLPSSG